ncbi:DUF2332 domain-containing protein [Demequina sp. NBRC 110053]|uniref:DUF2332 domain-containing protein n=1 Tax=Demequina sp. NBRC 110053 TaxID=1570342 RepID=UPI00135640A0|nr:DUF2332 domain-containing protein [Demequina sp. NBRC 110053]
MPTTAWSAADRADLAQVAAEVLRWERAVPDSPLYSAFALGIASDPDLLRVVAAIDNVPPLNLLFGAVKLTLDRADALAAWYPHLTSDPRVAGGAAFAAFRTYVLERERDLLAIASAHRTQTNETARAAVLLPWMPAQVPVHAIDLGASAGLNLCLDHFSYRYTGDRRATLGAGEPRITCEVRGEVELPESLPTFATRTGIDLAPVDPTDPEAAAWLEALVWPEHQDRLDRLRAAIAVRRGVDVRMVAGDAASALADVLDALPPGPAVIWHTIALYQASATAQADIDAAVNHAARLRDVTRIGFEPVASGRDPEVRVGHAFGAAEVVATAHPHGRWLQVQA